MFIDSLVCTVGTSGPVVTETVAFLDKKNGRPPQDIHLIVSSDEHVQENAAMIEAAIFNRYGPKIGVTIHKMQKEDIENYSDLIDFMRLCKEVVVGLRERFPAAKIGFLISGGRKTESVAASFVAVSMGVDFVFHVHSKNATPYNIPLERARALIKDLYLSDDKNRFYGEHADKFNEICYPPFDTYEVIPLLITPFPPKFMERIINAMRNCPASKERMMNYLSLEELNELAKREFLYLHGKDYILSKKGEDIIKIFGD